MGREIITIHIGQAGVQLSQALWDLVCIEHGVSCDGQTIDFGENSQNYGGTEYVFQELTNRKLIPRALLVDLEPTVIDEVRTGAYRNLWPPQQLIMGKEDAASNFARGYYHHSRFDMCHLLNQIRRIIENCENLGCFKLLYSANGGTGSGLTSALCEHLSDDYGKKYKFATSVYPSPGFSELMVEPYNAVLHSSTNLTFCDCVVLADNEALLNVMTDNLKIRAKGFTCINRVIANAVTTQFLAHRYNFIGQNYTNIDELLTNLIPYPRIHFPIMAFAPIFGSGEERFSNSSAMELLNSVFQDSNQLLSITTSQRAYISCALLFRGNITPADIVDGIANFKRNKFNQVRFVDWCPTGFKIGLNSTSPLQQQDRTSLALGDTSLSMIAGNLAVCDIWTGISCRFDQLRQKNAFVHWYVAEGMEEAEFTLAREVIQQLMEDYESIAREAETYGPDSFSQCLTSRSHEHKLSKVTNSMSQPPASIRAMTLDDTNSMHTTEINDENLLLNTSKNNASSLVLQSNHQTRPKDCIITRERLSMRSKLNHVDQQYRLAYTRQPYSCSKELTAGRNSACSMLKTDVHSAMKYGTNCSAIMTHDSQDQLNPLLQHMGDHETVVKGDTRSNGNYHSRVITTDQAMVHKENRHIRLQNHCTRSKNIDDIQPDEHQHYHSQHVNQHSPIGLLRNKNRHNYKLLQHNDLNNMNKRNGYYQRRNPKQNKEAVEYDNKSHVIIENRSCKKFFKKNKISECGFKKQGNQCFELVVEPDRLNVSNDRINPTCVIGINEEGINDATKSLTSIAMKCADNIVRNDTNEVRPNDVQQMSDWNMTINYPTPGEGKHHYYDHLSHWHRKHHLPK